MSSTFVCFLGGLALQFKRNAGIEPTQPQPWFSRVELSGRTILSALLARLIGVFSWKDYVSVPLTMLVGLHSLSPPEVGSKSAGSSSLLIWDCVGLGYEVFNKG